LADLGHHSQRRRPQVVRRVHGRLREHPAWAITMAYAAHWGAGDRRMTWRILDQAIAVQPDVRSGRLPVDRAEMITVSLPEVLPAKDVFDPMRPPLSARPLDLVSAGAVEDTIIRGAAPIIRAIEAATGTTICLAARDEIVRAWQHFAVYLIEHHRPGDDALVDHARRGPDAWDHLVELWDRAVPARHGWHHCRAVRLAILGTCQAHGPLVWLAEGRTLAQADARVVRAWAAAATAADPRTFRDPADPKGWKARRRAARQYQIPVAAAAEDIDLRAVLRGPSVA
jgi:hypothetical protein